MVEYLQDVELFFFFCACCRKGSDAEQDEMTRLVRSVSLINVFSLFPSSELSILGASLYALRQNEKKTLSGPWRRLLCCLAFSLEHALKGFSLIAI